MIAALLLAAAVLAPQLPTGKHLDAVGTRIELGNFPLAMTKAPGGQYLLVLLSGWRDQGLQVIDLAAGKVVQTVPLDSSFLGLAFSPDGKTVYASGANDDVIHTFAWRENRLAADRKIDLKRLPDDKPGSRYPAGLAVSADGRRLYVAENVGDSLAVIDAASGKVMQRFATGHYPYGVAVAGDGTVYVSSWGSNTVSIFRPVSGELVADGTIAVGRHPSTLLLDRSGSRLFATLASVDRVAVIDTRRKRVLGYLDDSSPRGPREGSTPNAIALSHDESLLYVAEADNNAVAVFRIADFDGARAPIGRIPVDWYPAALLSTPERLFVLSGKGGGTAPFPQGRTPAQKLEPRDDYVLAMINGSIRIIDLPVERATLAGWTRRVARANGWDAAPRARLYPPFRHVLYIIKENRTYDQVFGDLQQGDGDPALLFFPPEASPNHRALAARFGLFDRFFTSAEVSSQGHVWSTAGYVPDYIEKAVHEWYSYKRPTPDDEGEAEDPAAGYLWNRAVESGVSFRNYGEFATVDPEKKVLKATKAPLAELTSPTYPSFDLSVPDQKRADAWLAEFDAFVRSGSLPALMLMHLPNDHTAGGRAGRRTPRSYFADNDLALGRIVSAISKSPYWRDTVVFVMEDDAQDGADHVDSHRSVLLVISAYNRPGVRHRFVNTTDVLSTIEQLLRIAPMSQFDYYSRPLADVFASTADLTPYEPLTPGISLEEMNPSTGAAAKASANLDLSRPDAIRDDVFNRALWLTIKGDMPYPGSKRATPGQLLDMSR